MSATMASKDLAIQDDPSGLSPRQVAALERLSQLGAEPAPISADGKPQWDSDPQIRAFQMVYEGRFGGPQNGAGRKRQPRAAEVIAEQLREDHRVKNMVKAIDRALKKDAGARANLDAVKLAVELEKGERKLQIEEEEHEGNIGTTREEIIAALFELVQDPATVAAIEGGTAEEITDAEVIGEETSSSFAPVTERNGSNGNSTSAQENGRNGGSARTDGRKSAKGDSSESKNPLKKAALRRAANR